MLPSKPAVVSAPKISAAAARAQRGGVPALAIASPAATPAPAVLAGQEPLSFCFIEDERCLCYLPREVVESPSLEMFRTRLDGVLCGLLWVTLLRRGGWTR